MLIVIGGGRVGDGVGRAQGKPARRAPRTDARSAPTGWAMMRDRKGRDQILVLTSCGSTVRELSIQQAC